MKKETIYLLGGVFLLILGLISIFFYNTKGAIELLVGSAILFFMSLAENDALTKDKVKKK